MPAKRKADSTPSSSYKRARTTPKKKATRKMPKATKATQDKSGYAAIFKNPMLNHPPCQLTDSFRGATVPLVLNSTRSLMPNSVGNHAGLMFRPSLNNCFKNTTAVSGNDILVWDADYTSHPEYDSLADLQNTALRVRFLAVGIQLIYTGSADSRSGTITYGFSNSPETISPDGNSLPDMHMDSGIVPIKNGGNTFMLRPFDRPGFIPIGNMASEYFNGCILIVNGCDPSDILVRSKVYVEIIPDPASVLADSARPSPAGVDPKVPFQTHTVKQD
ncbi:unnamed protein product [Pylaiella littoralis]